jgi:hypothetical protein
MLVVISTRLNGQLRQGDLRWQLANMAPAARARDDPGGVLMRVAGQSRSVAAQRLQYAHRPADMVGSLITFHD